MSKLYYVTPHVWYRRQNIITAPIFLNNELFLDTWFKILTFDVVYIKPSMINHLFRYLIIIHVDMTVYTHILFIYFNLI